MEVLRTCSWEVFPQLVKKNIVINISDKIIFDFIPSINSVDRFKLYKDNHKSWA
jgi:hypothetical protein